MSSSLSAASLGHPSALSSSSGADTASTSVPSPSSSDPFASPTTSPSNGGRNSHSNNPATRRLSTQLYLYIFLGTLIFLLCAASSSALRSFLLRRRRAPLTPHVKVNRPRLYDTYVAPSVDAGASDDWEAIMPLAASYITPSTTLNAALTTTNLSESLIPKAANIIFPEHPSVCVAVLIAMPFSVIAAYPHDSLPDSSHSVASQTQSSEGSDLPHLEVGVGVVAAKGRDEGKRASRESG
ncbi:hypothetical protein C8R43DRAFT_1130730 [Mycena crocata]|nr:hypothetical protein C8R43DRAFT_1130730 [Mycena crocata]